MQVLTHIYTYLTGYLLILAPVHVLHHGELQMATMGANEGSFCNVTADIERNLGAFSFSYNSLLESTVYKSSHLVMYLNELLEGSVVFMLDLHHSGARCELGFCYENGLAQFISAADIQLGNMSITTDLYSTVMFDAQQRQRIYSSRVRSTMRKFNQLILSYNQELHGFRRFATPVMKFEYQRFTDMFRRISDDLILTAHDINSFVAKKFGIDVIAIINQGLKVYQKVVALNTQQTRATAVLVIFYTLLAYILGKLIIWTQRPTQKIPSPEDLEDNRTDSVYDYDITHTVGYNGASMLHIVTRTNLVTGFCSKIAVKVVGEMAIPKPGFLAHIIMTPLCWITGNNRLLKFLRLESLRLREFLTSRFIAGYASAKFARDTAVYFLNIPTGDTLSQIVKDGNLKRSSLRFLLVEMVKAIRALHDMNSACGVLTPDNVVIGLNGSVSILTSCVHTFSMQRRQLLFSKAVVAQDWVHLGKFLLGLLLKSEIETNEDGSLSQEAIAGLQNLEDRFRTLIQHLLSNKMTDRRVLSHAFFEGINWEMTEEEAFKVKSPFFMIHDLENTDSFFSMDYATEEDQIADVVRYLEGCGRYDLVSL